MALIADDRVAQAVELLREARSLESTGNVGRPTWRTSAWVAVKACAPLYRPFAVCYREVSNRGRSHARTAASTMRLTKRGGERWATRSVGRGMQAYMGLREAQGSDSRP
ncbi:hypothetical protein NDU88_008221 [Pleurodeles waltl]|uniref:Uncharacterized protein n=1 Tax=Pleurodeles waltl TaxID=8319 RepID=A0AAV7QP33_PLEWA|nr:hypothetical protein NDU88_008221 [Pleurodeles waltl]